MPFVNLGRTFEDLDFAVMCAIFCEQFDCYCAYKADDNHHLEKLREQANHLSQHHVHNNTKYCIMIIAINEYQ